MWFPGVNARVRPGWLLASAVFLTALVSAGAVEAGEVPFAQQTNLTTANAATAVVLGDLDGDGDLDAIHSDSGIGAPRTRWQENTDGAGSFGAPQSLYSAAAGRSGLAVADIDGNGKLDVVVGGTGVVWIQNPADGGSSYTVSSLLPSVNAVAVGDLDADGDVDVVAASTSTGSFAWWENDGTPAVGTWTRHDIASGFTTAYAVDVADMNGDGFLDVIGTDFGDSAAYYFENDGTPHAGWTTNTISATASGPASLRAGDMDGDGDLDVSLANSGSGIVEWWENDGDPGSLDWTLRSVTSDTIVFHSVAPVDVDADGDLDLVVGGNDGAPSDADPVEWHENLNGLGTSWAEHGVDTTAGSGMVVAPGDVDGDGDLDLFVAATATEITWYRQDRIHASAEFARKHIITSASDGVQRLLQGDVDGDGDIDVVAQAPTSNVLELWENTAGDGSAWSATTIAAEDSTDMVLVDMDGDGALDVLRGFNGTGPRWEENDAGDGSSWTQHSLGSASTRQIAAADLDSDGDPDVLATRNSTMDLVWFENQDGIGTTWSAANVLDSGTDFAKSLEVADMNRDGTLDVLVAWDDDGIVSWYENDGTPGGLGDWTEHVVASSLTNPRVAHALDLTRDGALDVAIRTASGVVSVQWYENTNGLGTSWGTAQTITAEVAGDDIGIADLDRDGDLDLVYPDRVGDVVWRENTSGDGSTWTDHVFEPSSDDTGLVLAGDVDGDGDPDLFVASGNDDTVAWYENGGGQFALPTEDVSRSGGALQAGEEALLAIAAAHRGRSGDSDVAVATLELLFEESPGDPLSTLEANALVERLRVYEDDGSGDFDGADTEIIVLETLALTAGTQTLATLLDADFLLAHGTPRTWFVVAELTATAASQSPNTLRLTHDTSASSTGEDASTSLPASLEYATNASAEVVALDPSSDADGDGLSNQDELDTAGTDPFDADTDGDGLSDGDEVDVHGSDPLDPDDDGDGWTDGTEVALGSDPTALGSTPAYVSDTPFSEATAIATGLTDAQDMAAGDVDGDGDLDVVYTSRTGSKIAWYDNDNGDASSWTQRTVDSIASQGVVVDDIDGDGDLDALTANLGTMRWHENDGGDGLTWNTTSFSGTGIVQGAGLATGDVDGDGDMDLLSASSREDRIRWFENIGGVPIAFVERLVSSGVENASDVTVADLDRDGDLDVISTSLGAGGALHPEDNSVFWHENGGSGLTWTDHQLVQNPAGGYRQPNVGDVDGDGDLDIVVAASGRTAVEWLENTAGDASDWERRILSTVGVISIDVRLMDMDADGDLDVAAVRGVSPHVTWHENLNGDGSVWPPFDLSFSSSTGGAVTVADPDGDGDVDVLTLDAAGGALRWMRNDTLHRSAHFVAGASFATGEEPEAAAAGDIDGDGDLDVVLVTTGVAAKVVWRANTSGDGSTWAAAVTIDGAAVHRDPSYGAPPGLFLADLDADGDLDVLATTDTDGRAVWHENAAGDGSAWSEHLLTDTLPSPADIIAADLDADGDLDVAIGSYLGNSTSELQWLENDALTFTPATVVASGTPRDVAAADVDGDGDLDLVANQIVFADAIHWYENANGDGSLWTQRTIATVAGNTTAVVAADLDGDGDVDVATCGQALGVAVEMYENTAGNGLAWTTHQLEFDLDGCGDLEAADVDLDGDIDLIAYRWFSGRDTVYYENSGFGPGSFIRHDLGDGGRIKDGAIGDLDGDGDLDLVMPRYNTDMLEIWPNRGGQFALTTRNNATGTLDGAADDVLTFDFIHRGRAGEPVVELASVELLFQDELGSPLSSVQAAALFTAGTIVADDGSGVYETANDTTSVGVFSPSLTSGRLTVAITDGLPAAYAVPGTPSTYFVVLTMQPAASGAAVNRFEVVHVTESSSTAEDTINDMPLQLEYVPDTASGLIWALDALGDADSDGLDNETEIDSEATDPLDPDTDGDTVSDGDEVNTHLSDPLDTDTDDDGLDDGTEVGFVFDPLDPDTDGDEYCDGPLNPGGACTLGISDNCPALSNAAQTNNDSLPAGDDCQCGNLDATAGISAADLLALREVLVGRTPSGGAPDLDFCDVDDDGVCSVADASVLDRFLAGASATVETTCPAYLGTP